MEKLNEQGWCDRVIALMYDGLELGKFYKEKEKEKIVLKLNNNRIIIIVRIRVFLS